MNVPFKKLAATTLMLAGLSVFTAPAQANITPQQSAEILKTYSADKATDFRKFLGSLGKSDLAKTADIVPAIGAYLDNKT